MALSAWRGAPHCRDCVGSAGSAQRRNATDRGPRRTVALTLTRPEDVDAVPALLKSDAPVDYLWPAIIEWAGHRRVADVAGRARLLGLPVGVLGGDGPCPARGAAVRQSQWASEGSWGSTCPGCGPDPCLGNCSPQLARRWSKSRAHCGPTAPARVNGSSSTGWMAERFVIPSISIGRTTLGDRWRLPAR